jgi:hypothetical protein
MSKGVESEELRVRSEEWGTKKPILIYGLSKFKG